MSHIRTQLKRSRVSIASFLLLVGTLATLSVSVQLANQPTKMSTKAKSDDAAITFTETDPAKASFKTVQKNTQELASGATLDEECSPDQVIVKYATDTNTASVQKLKSKVKQNHNANTIRSWNGNTELLKVNSKADRDNTIKALKQDSAVAYAELDCKVYPDIMPIDPYFADNSLWGLHNIGQQYGKVDADIDAPEAWDKTTGSSDIVVAVIDTGVDYNHADLRNNMWVNPGEIAGNNIDDDNNCYIDDVYGINAIISNSCTAPVASAGNPLDDHGHGSHVAGTIGAVANNNVGVVGVAWNVKLMSIKFLGPEGGYISQAISAIDYVLLMKSRGVNIRLTSNSWGGTSYSQALYDAINRLKSQNILFVAAAGNNGLDTDYYHHYPSSYDLSNIISVAASDRNDQIASFSNFGPVNTDLLAPGVSIKSTFMRNSYAVYNGTSMAAPHVSGALVLLLSVSPYNSWSMERLKDHLMATTDPVDLKWRTYSGGRLNINNALAAPAAAEFYPKTLFLSIGTPRQASGKARLINNSANSVSWSITKTQPWLVLSSSSGTIPANAAIEVPIAIDARSITQNTEILDTLGVTIGTNPAQPLAVRAVLTSNPFVRFVKDPPAGDIDVGMATAMVNIDNDAYTDLYVSGFIYNFLFKNINGTQFSTLPSIFYSEDGGWLYGHTWGDYDNDGFIDVYIAGFLGTASSGGLYRNKKDGTFEKVTNSGIGGILGTGASFADYDHDGYLDLAIAGFNSASEVNFLFRNNLGSSSPATVFSRIAGVTSTSHGGPSSVTWADYNNDTYPDLFFGIMGYPNRLYKNNGGTSFTQITSGEMVTMANTSDGGSWADFDYDGDLDVFIGYGRAPLNRLFRNDGNDVFNSVSIPVVGYSRSGSWADYDNDGDLDLYIPADVNQLLINEFPSPTFTKIVDWPTINESAMTYGASWGDINNDGALDLFISNLGKVKRLLLVNTPNSNKFAEVSLIGYGKPYSNKSAIGAKVYADATISGTLRRQMREVSAQSGPNSQNELRQHFGFGATTKIDRLYVKWPSGNQSVLYDYDLASKSPFITIKETPRGDCNGDLKVDAGDITATALEVYDEDGADPLNTPKSTFAGNPSCDSKKDGVMNDRDTMCVSKIIFGGPNAVCL